MTPRKKNPPLHTINPTKTFLKEKEIDIGHLARVNFYMNLRNTIM